jgi:hypothetical protein
MSQKPIHKHRLSFQIQITQLPWRSSSQMPRVARLINQSFPIPKQTGDFVFGCQKIIKSIQHRQPR